MDKKPSGFKARWKARYHHASIQLILSIAFTAVAVIGMLFLGMALLLRFSSSANEMAAESSQRVLAQVNWNLDSYLRNMMRVSDTVYYRVIKSADLEQSDTARELRDALKLLYAKDRDVLVSLAVFDENGELISATPLTELKNSVTPSREGWFTAAMERIEGMMDKVVEGFEKQLDQLFQGDALDITTDVEVLERMLSKDGLSSQDGIRLEL